MATVIIPDKICPHCNGTKWRVEYDAAPTKANPEKLRVRYRCSIKAYEKTERWRANHPNHVREWGIGSTRGRVPNPQYNQEKYRQRHKAQDKRDCKNLTDRYIKLILTDSYKSVIKGSDIPLELIELQRNSLKLKRQLKTQKHGKSNKNNN